MPSKIELGSPEWMAEFERLLRQHLATLPADFKFSVCEVYTDAPAHLANREDGSIAWHCFIEGPAVTFGDTEIPEADFKVKADYDYVLQLAKWIHDPATVREHEALRQRGVSEGKLLVWGDRSRANFLHDMHNELALITL